MKYFCKIGACKRVSLPKELCQKYGIKEGSIVIVEDAHPEYGIMIRPAKVVPASDVNV